MATRLAERVVEREQELRAVRAELVALRAAGDEGLRAHGRAGGRPGDGATPGAAAGDADADAGAARGGRADRADRRAWPSGRARPASD